MTQRLIPDLCVIGAGSAGLAAAAGAAQMGAEVVLIERGLMGGHCLYFGCVPSKSLLAAARLAELARRGAALGIISSPSQVDFAAAMSGVHAVIAAIAPNDSEERFTQLGVRVLRTKARFTDPRTVRADDTEIRPRRFVIATGSYPAIPAIPGLDGVRYLTNETVFANYELPEHLIIIGGGPIGIEMAQAHHRLGARVTVLDIGPLLPHDDPE
ncbi:MAG TPA: FAD-dependent oxidoreductase, partial [Stellaceae bacterium]|nr:FAD-dependent oxidoreductase [Stellaceae bacterium]